MKTYDIAIIGSGPGGYVSALYASRSKASVCVIEKGLVGGTCLNRGCIPTKSLITSASLLSAIKYSKTFGVSVEKYKLDFNAVTARKNEVVTRLRTGIETLFRANKIDIVKAAAKINKDLTIDAGEYGLIKASSIIIATGSRPSVIKDVLIDEKGILSSDGVLEIQSVPGSITIIGGGVIGCEFAHIFSSFGSKVTVVEAMDRILPAQSREASKKIETIFKKRGLDIHTSSKLKSVKNGTPVEITLSNGTVIQSDKVLVSVGRTPLTAGLGLEDAGIETHAGKISVDGGLRTSRKNVYAIGDCVDGPQLAHKATYDGILACDNIAGEDRKTDYSNIPNCIWTEPEIASVGLSEEEARVDHEDIKVAKFPYMASGKAYLEGKTEGFVKITGTKAGKILGVEIVGSGACDLISEAALAKTMNINVKDWSRVVHGHPTISEILQEAAHVFCGTPIHSI